MELRPLRAADGVAQDVAVAVEVCQLQVGGQSPPGGRFAQCLVHRHQRRAVQRFRGQREGRRERVRADDDCRRGERFLSQHGIEHDDEDSYT